MKNILVVGSSNTDMIIRVPHIPAPGETILGGEFSMAPGGKGANQAVAAARAGGRVTFLACVGHDLFGAAALKNFAADGINGRFVVQDGRAPSGVALINVGDDGENSISVASGANALLAPEDVLRAEKAFEGADILLMQLETPIETVRAAAELALARGIPVILNPAPARPLPPELLRSLDYLVVNEIEAEALSGVKVDSVEGAAAAGRRLREAGAGNVLVTLGARGVVTVAAGGAPRHDPAPRVQAVDTTAAGDTFIGGLCAALVEGRALPEAVRFAQAAAAISVTRFGAQTSIPRRSEVKE
jgi:ribokinase